MIKLNSEGYSSIPLPIDGHDCSFLDNGGLEVLTDCNNVFWTPIYRKAIFKSLVIDGQKIFFSVLSNQIMLNEEHNYRMLMIMVKS